jgi:hypothetical protein
MVSIICLGSSGIAAGTPSGVAKRASIQRIEAWASSVNPAIVQFLCLAKGDMPRKVANSPDEI